MEEIITEVAENAAEIATEQVIKSRSVNFKKCAIVILGGGAAAYGLYRVGKYLYDKHMAKKAAAETEAQPDDFIDNVEVAKRDFLDEEPAEE